MLPLFELTALDLASSTFRILKCRFDSHALCIFCAVRDADVVIGLSARNPTTSEMVATIAEDSIIFVLDVAEPEITPEAARAAGRPEYPNLITDVLVLPGIFRGAMDVRARIVNDEMKLAAARRVASLVTEHELQEGQIIPLAMDYDVVPVIASTVARTAMESGVARSVDPQLVAQHCHDFIYEGLQVPVPPLEDGHK